MSAYFEGFSSNITAFIQSNTFFSELEPDALKDLETELERLFLAAGEQLFRQGDPGDSMYILLRGALTVKMKDESDQETHIDVLDSGASVGEMALLTGQNRSATVQALVDTELIRLSKTGFERLYQKHPEVMNSFTRHVQPRFERSQLSVALAKLFGPVDAATLHDLQNKVTWMHLPAREALFYQGEVGDAMYIVINGRLNIMVQNEEGKEKLLAEIGRGETVGEFALISGEPRTATVIAARDSDVVALSKTVFEGLIQKYPQSMLEITRAIVQRSWSKPHRTAYDSTTTTAIAVVPAQAGLPLPAFMQNLVKVLTENGTVLYLSSERFDSLYGKTGAAGTELTHPTSSTLDSWLNDQERSYRTVVYLADPENPAWTQRCLRQSDRILLLADAAMDPASLPMERVLYTGKEDTRVQLVLLHPSQTERPSGTLRWLERLPVHAYHHLRLDHSEDFQRMVRRLTGTATGLVLSGGGARGFAHAGAIRAMEEAKMDIDLIGGTSMGALVGACLAMDMPYSALINLAHTFANPKKILDYTLPFTSLVATHKITQLLQDLFGDTQIEDLWKPFFCLSSNLTRAEGNVHQTGSLWEAVRASLAIPGIFSPMFQAGQVLVDGGVMNTFPVDTMVELCEGGPVIGVNASAKTDKFGGYSFGPSISGWKVLWSKINPFARRYQAPSILENLMRATEINSISRQKLQENLCSVLIKPRVEAYGSLDFAAYPEIIQIGYDTARQQLETWNGRG